MSKWKPGVTKYKDFLDSLTDEQYQQHLHERRLKKAMKKSMEVVVKEHQAQLLALSFNASVKLMTQALEEGDTAAYKAVWDRIIGRPDSLTEEQAEDNAALIAAIVAMAGNLPD